MEKITYTLREGPVKVLSNNGKGIKKTYKIWYEMTCSEYFPPDTESAFYVVEISQAVSNSNEVDFAKENIEDMIRRLERVWMLAGGGKMQELQITEIKGNTIPNNVEKVREKLLKSEGFEITTIAGGACVGYDCTYNRFPLKHAIDLVDLANPANHPELNEVYKHFHVGMSENPLWYSELYKIKDDFKRILKTDKPFKALNMKSDGRFEEILTRLRHTPWKEKNLYKGVSTQEKAEVRAIGRLLVESYIKDIGHGHLLITPPAE